MREVVSRSAIGAIANLGLTWRGQSIECDSTVGTVFDTAHSWAHPREWSFLPPSQFAWSCTLLIAPPPQCMSSTDSTGRKWLSKPHHEIATRGPGSSDRTSNSPPLPIRPGGTVIPSALRMPQSRLPLCASASCIADYMHGPSYWLPPGISGLLIKQHHTTKFPSEMLRDCSSHLPGECRHASRRDKQRRTIVVQEQRVTGAKLSASLS